MKIKFLWISEYKNIKGINLNFKSDTTTLLVGQNGLGKSNLLEALAIIFTDLDLLQSKDQFDEWAYEEGHFEYKIAYECKQADIEIHCMADDFRVFKREIGSTEKIAEVDFSEFRKTKERDLLPDFVIGYYSGENKRIKGIISRHEEFYYTRLKNWNKKSGKDQEESFRRVFFTENIHSQLLLLTLALYDESKDHGVFIKELLNTYLKIEQVNQLEIRFNNPDWSYDKINGINKGAEFLIENINRKNEVENPFWNIKGKVSKLLTRLYNHQIENASEPFVYPNEKEDTRKFVKEFLEFDDINFQTFKLELPEFFPTPIDFFEAIESTIILDILSSILITVEKTAVGAPVTFSQLSEGEQQLLTVMAMVIIFEQYECLILLDEPDTHLNPIWQRDYVSLLNKFNLGKDRSHIMVATHSPLIVQSSEGADVILFYREDDVIKVELSEIPYNNWRADHVLTSKYFGLENARPRDEKMDAFMRLRAQILSQDQVSKVDIQKLREFNTDDLFPTGETFEDLVAMQIIRTEAKEIQNDLDR